MRLIRSFILFFLTFYVTNVVCFSQSQVATLEHDGDLSVYYGGNALKEAYQYAVNGDVITLSAGAFNSVNIDKKLITIRGAGMGIKLEENDRFFNPTVLVGDFSVNADSSEGYSFSLEGIVNYNTMTLLGTNNTKFEKCKFGIVTFEAGSGSLQNCNFIHCFVSKKFTTRPNITFNAINSYIKDATFTDLASSFTLINCIIEINNSPGKCLRGTAMTNCIIINIPNLANTNTYAENSVSYYSLWVGFKKTLQDSECNNYVYESKEDIFIMDTFCKLKDSFRELIGSDGKELGIYGGTLPFESSITDLYIKKFEVAPKTTVDGKLNINVEFVNQ